MLADIFGIGALIQQFLDGIVCFIETGVIFCANLIISGLAYVVGLVIGVLPSMPGADSIPSWVHQGYEYVSYWFPVDWAFAFAGSFVTFYIAWVIAAIVLRWAKAVSGSA